MLLWSSIEMLSSLVVTGPFLLTLLLLDLLTSDRGSRDTGSRSRARIINVSSRAHRRAAPLDHDDVMLAGHTLYWPSLIQYPHSKLANVLFTRELARRLGNYHIVIIIII